MIGVPLDLGQQRRGVDMGPSAVRVAGLEAKLEALGHIVEDAGNIAVMLAEQKNPGELHARYLREITATCKKHADLVCAILREGAVRSRSAAITPWRSAPSSGLAEFYRGSASSASDSSGSTPTPTSTPRRPRSSGNVHGMPLAAIMGLGPKELAELYGWSPKVPPENCVLVGIRDVDLQEKENIRRAGIEAFTMRDIDERGMRTVMEEALRIAGRGTVGYHISVDMDCIDPEDAPGVGTPVPGGVTYREAHLAMEIIADHGRMTQLRDRRGQPGDRRTQPHRRTRRRPRPERLRKEDSVTGVTS